MRILDQVKILAAVKAKKSILLQSFSCYKSLNLMVSILSLQKMYNLQIAKQKLLETAKILCNVLEDPVKTCMRYVG